MHLKKRSVARSFFVLISVFLVLSLAFNPPVYSEEQSDPSSGDEETINPPSLTSPITEKEKGSSSQEAEVATTEDKPTQEKPAPAAEETLTEETVKEEEAPPPPAIKGAPPVVVDIEVRGNQIISTNTIINRIQTKAGGKLVQEVINSDIKRLYATGFFYDIKFEVEQVPKGYRVVIVVDEKPIVRQIIIDGNTVMKEKKLRKEINLLEGQILDRRAVKQGVVAIKQKYLNKGYKFVDVKSEIDINEETKEAIIYILISEGEEYKIKKISFEGIRSFKENEIRDLLKTKPKGWIWFLQPGVFKEDQFRTDLDRIASFYQKNGFLDVKVVPKMDYDREGKWIFITIQIEEGKQYITGDINIVGNVLFPESEIWQNLEMLPGHVYSQYYMANDIDAIRSYYFDRGYMECQVMPDVRLNKATGKVDIVYNITEGDLYFVDKVKVRGNTKTKDIVIRRELRVRPGERFDGEKIKRSVQRLENLGFFEEVNWDTEPSNEPNRRDIIFRVKEKQTGELSFGAGVSSVDKFIGFAEIAQRNFDLTNWPTFTGAGQSFSLRGRLGSITRDFDLSFVEPYIFNKPVSFGTNLYLVDNLRENTDFETRRMGGSVNFGKAFTEYVTAGIGYTLENVKLKDVSSSAGQDVLDTPSSSNLSRVRFTASRDSRDNRFAPTRGSLLTGSAEIIGGLLGGGQDYYITQFGATKYWSFKKGHVIEFRFRLGLMGSYGKTDITPVYDRFYAGGLGTVRGFGYRRVGPKQNGQAVGGNTMVIGNIEYSWPIVKNFKGIVFVDAGQVERDTWSIKAGKFAISIGPGVKVNTPIGPMILYYGFPIANRDTKEKNGKFEFSFSRGF